MVLFEELHEHGVFERIWNAMFSVFVPKKGVDNLKDFKLISLVGCLYKFSTKVMTNRIEKLIQTVVFNA